MSFTDTGLAPGSTHTYTVTAPTPRANVEPGERGLGFHRRAEQPGHGRTHGPGQAERAESFLVLDRYNLGGGDATP